MKRWYILISVYLILHIAVMTRYSVEPKHSELWQWFYTIQWVVPTFMIALLIPRLQRLLDRVANVRIWTGWFIILVMMCVLTYFTSETMKWFAWSTLGLLVLLMTYIANCNRHLGNVNAWLLGAMITLMTIGSWEILYQTGLLFYHSFFGLEIMTYYVTVALQFLWIIPALIVVLVLYKRGLKLSSSKITFICIGISFLATGIWFANGMDIPLLFWKGEGPWLNTDANPLMISVSRASQSFWLVGIASLFTRKPF